MLRHRRIRELNDFYNSYYRRNVLADFIDLGKFEVLKYVTV